jgi:hypothetical protein
VDFYELLLQQKDLSFSLFLGYGAQDSEMLELPGGRFPEFCANSTSRPKIVFWLAAEIQTSSTWLLMVRHSNFIFHTLFHDSIYRILEDVEDIMLKVNNIPILDSSHSDILKPILNFVFRF